MTQSVASRRQQAELVSACLAELGIDAHPNTVRASIQEAPGGKGYVVTVANTRRGPLRVHVLAVAPDGGISRVRYNQKV